MFKICIEQLLIIYLVLTLVNHCNLSHCTLKILGSESNQNHELIFSVYQDRSQCQLMI